MPNNDTQTEDSGDEVLDVNEKKEANKTDNDKPVEEGSGWCCGYCGGDSGCGKIIKQMMQPKLVVDLVNPKFKAFSHPFRLALGVGLLTLLFTLIAAVRFSNNCVELTFMGNTEMFNEQMDSGTFSCIFDISPMKVDPTDTENRIISWNQCHFNGMEESNYCVSDNWITASATQCDTDPTVLFYTSYQKCPGVGESLGISLGYAGFIEIFFTVLVLALGIPTGLLEHENKLGFIAAMQDTQKAATMEEKEASAGEDSVIKGNRKLLVDLVNPKFKSFTRPLLLASVVGITTYGLVSATAVTFQNSCTEKTFLGDEKIFFQEKGRGTFPCIKDFVPMMMDDENRVVSGESCMMDPAKEYTYISKWTRTKKPVTMGEEDFCTEEDFSKFNALGGDICPDEMGLLYVNYDTCPNLTSSMGAALGYSGMIGFFCTVGVLAISMHYKWIGHLNGANFLESVVQVQNDTPGKSS